MSKANRPFRHRFAADTAGAFPVLEAILVAILVLGALLFFTALQRPTTGAEQGGLDLAQVAADTLQILQTKQFGVHNDAAAAYVPSTATGQSLEGWVTNATKGDTATTTAANDFLRQVLPTGSRYSLRLGNGVGALPILPKSAVGDAHAARAASIILVPNWATFATASGSSAMLTVQPGQVVAASSTCNAAATTAVDCLVRSGTYLCYESPLASVNGPNGSSWLSRWQSALQTVSPTTNGKGLSSEVGAGNQQVPNDLPLGKWRLSSDVAASGHCTAGTVTYVDVVAPGVRSLSVSTTIGSAILTNAAGRFTAADVGLGVAGTGIPAGAHIISVSSATTATMSANAVSSSSPTVDLPMDPTFTPYMLQLVVWFGT